MSDNVNQLNQVNNRAFQKILSKNNLGGLSFTLLLTNWSQIIGPTYSKSSYPIKVTYSKVQEKLSNLVNEHNIPLIKYISVNKSILHLRVKSSAVATELSYQRNLILNKISSYFGYKLIDDIVWHIEG